MCWCIVVIFFGFRVWVVILVIGVESGYGVIIFSSMLIILVLVRVKLQCRLVRVKVLDSVCSIIRCGQLLSQLVSVVCGQNLIQVLLVIMMVLLWVIFSRLCIDCGLIICLVGLFGLQMKIIFMLFSCVLMFGRLSCQLVSVGMVWYLMLMVLVLMLYMLQVGGQQSIVFLLGLQKVWISSLMFLLVLWLISICFGLILVQWVQFLIMVFGCGFGQWFSVCLVSWKVMVVGNLLVLSYMLFLLFSW